MGNLIIEGTYIHSTGYRVKVKVSRKDLFRQIRTQGKKKNRYATLAAEPKDLQC